MKEGDIVTRKSYNQDIIFKITGFSKDENNKKIALLKDVKKLHKTIILLRKLRNTQFSILNCVFFLILLKTY